MKAITIKQPFASLIAAGLKEYEFRTWKMQKRNLKLRQDESAIHGIGI